jgi:ribonuclease P protein component
MAPEGAANSSASRRKGNPRSGRLLRHADFERVYKQGRRHFSAHMTVFYLRRTEGEGLRVGFTVGRALGGAVERNRMKRRLRESVRLMRPAIEPAADVVINPKKSLQTAEFSSLLAEVSRAFEVIAQKLSGETAREPTHPGERIKGVGKRLAKAKE